MKEFKGTDGLWEQVQIDDDNLSKVSGLFVKSESGKIVACIGPSNETTMLQDDANGALIASSPKLLKALQGIMTMFPVIEDDNSGRAGFTQEAIDKLNFAKQAIAEALGE